MNLIVSYYQFSISSPYSAGPHTLTAGEAQALNLLRADQLRKIAQRRVASVQDGSGGDLLSTHELEIIQSQIDDASRSFKFKYRELEERQSLLGQEMINLIRESDDKISMTEIGFEARRRLRAKASAISPEDLGF